MHLLRLVVAAILVLAILAPLEAKAKPTPSVQQRVNALANRLAEPPSGWSSHFWFLPERRHMEAVKGLGKIGATAIPRLAAELKRKERQRRFLAALALGKINVRRAEDLLVHTLRYDPFWGVREGAATALGSNPRAREPLLEWLRRQGDRPEHWVIRGLARFPHPRVVDALSRALELPIQGDILTYDRGSHAAVALASMPGLGPDRLVSLATSGNSRVRVRVAMALGNVRSRRSTATVLGLANDPEPAVRIQALDTLSRWKVNAALPVVRQRLRDPDGDVRMAAARALGEIGGVKSAADLIAVVRTGDTAAAPQAARQLGDLRCKEAVPALAEAATSGDFFLRIAGSYALAKIGGQEARKALETLLADEHLLVRRAALLAIGAGGDVMMIQAVRPLLKDGSHRVRSAAAEALGMLGDRDSIPALIQALRDIDPEARLGPISALGKLRAREALPELRRIAVEMAEDYLAETRAKAAKEAMQQIEAADNP